MEETSYELPNQDEIEGAPMISVEGWNHYFDDAGAYTFSTPAYAATAAAPNATRIALPDIPEGYWPVFDGESWRLMEDHRGGKGWLDGESATIVALGPLPNSWSDTPPEAVQSEEEMFVQKAYTLLYDASLKTQAETFEFTNDELIVIGKAGYLDSWVSGKDYQAGKRLMHNGSVYIVVQDVTAQSHQPPDATGMLVIYRPVDEKHAGTMADPIPFTYGMDVTNGKYYSFEGNTYLCKSDMAPCVWNPGTAGLWQWELAEK